MGRTLVRNGRRYVPLILECHVLSLNSNILSYTVKFISKTLSKMEIIFILPALVFN